MTPELQLFVELVRSFVAGDGEEPPPVDGVEWDELQSLLLSHRMLPALAPQIHRSNAPREFRSRIDDLTRRLQRRGALFLLELPRFLPALEAADCRPIVLKGAALGRTHYTSPSDRFVSDLDLLVPRDRVDRACEVMERFGYRRPPTRRHPEFYERHHFHRILESPAGVTAEIHWDLTRPADFFRFDLQGFFERSRVIQSEGLAIRVPADEDQLIHAASQSLDEGFSNLWRAVDAAVILGAGIDDPAELADRARAYGLGTALWVLLELSSAIAGVPAPATLEDPLAPAAGRRRCLTSLDIADKLLTGYAKQHTGHRVLLEWLCTPDLRTLVARTATYVVPGEARYLAGGHDPEALPGPGRRAIVGLRNAWSTVRIAAYQARCLATHRR